VFTPVALDGTRLPTAPWLKPVWGQMRDRFSDSVDAACPLLGLSLMLGLILTKSL
jgi:hypothetical protein